MCSWFQCISVLKSICINKLYIVIVPVFIFVKITFSQCGNAETSHSDVVNLVNINRRVIHSDNNRKTVSEDSIKRGRGCSRCSFLYSTYRNVKRFVVLLPKTCKTAHTNMNLGIQMSLSIGQTLDYVYIFKKLSFNSTQFYALQHITNGN